MAASGSNHVFKSISNNAFAVSDTIKSRQVCRGLGRRDDAIACDGKLCSGQGDVHNCRPSSFEFLERLFDCLSDVSIEIVVEKFARFSETKTANRLFGPAGVR